MCHCGGGGDDHDDPEYYYYIDGDHNYDGERINESRQDPCSVCVQCTQCCKEKIRHTCTVL